MVLAAQAFGGEQQALKTQKEKESYSTGIEFVRNLKQQGGAIDLDLVIQGIKDGLTGETLLMTEADIRTTMAVRRGGKAGQREGMKADSNTGIMPAPMSAGREDAPTAPNKQDTALPRTDQADQNDQLAASGHDNNPEGLQGQFAANRPIVQMPSQAPNGIVLSKRNQAKIGVAGMKAERAKAFDLP
jgi:hypothetical protein